MIRILARLNGVQRTLEFPHASDDRFVLDGESFTASAAAIQPGWYSLLIDGQSLEARVERIEGDLAAYRVVVEGEEFSIEIPDPRRWVRGGPGAQVEGVQRITAPMPGKVVRVLVSEGQAVEAGQGVVVVEAMKMQNEIRSPKAGTVGKVSASEGQTVAAGQALLVIE